MTRAALAIALLLPSALLAAECPTADACMEAAEKLSKKDIEPAELVERIKLLDRACDLGSGDGCLSLARVAPESPMLILKQRELLTRAATAFDRRCAERHVDDCVLLVRMYRAGEAVPLNHVSAEVAFRRTITQLARACGAKQRLACTTLADLYDQGGLGLAKNPARAKLLRKQ